MNGLHVTNQRDFQLWVYELLETSCVGWGLPATNIFYPGLVTEDNEVIPQDALHVRVWVRPDRNSNQAYSMGTKDQPRRMVSRGSIYIKTCYPAGLPSLLTDCWDLVILLQRVFQNRNHPCGVLMPSVVPDEIGKLDGDPYYQILLTARYEYDEFV